MPKVKPEKPAHSPKSSSIMVVSLIHLDLSDATVSARLLLTVLRAFQAILQHLNLSDVQLVYFNNNKPLCEPVASIPLETLILNR